MVGCDIVEGVGGEGNATSNRAGDPAQTTKHIEALEGLEDRVVDGDEAVDAPGDEDDDDHVLCGARTDEAQAQEESVKHSRKKEASGKATPVLGGPAVEEREDDRERKPESGQEVVEDGDEPVCVVPASILHLPLEAAHIHGLEGHDGSSVEASRHNQRGEVETNGGNLDLPQHTAGEGEPFLVGQRGETKGEYEHQGGGDGTEPDHHVPERHTRRANGIENNGHAGR
mmetsp:Transcript_3184/g.6765  ORF Transcript_3184/g.6765 Transcript_3184/m.6765 type:complete len:228 (+) Transcript_3184:1291-1974(+)